MCMLAGPGISASEPTVRNEQRARGSVGESRSLKKKWTTLSDLSDPSSHHTSSEEGGVSSIPLASVASPSFRTRLTFLILRCFCISTSDQADEVDVPDDMGEETGSRNSLTVWGGATRSWSPFADTLEGEGNLGGDVSPEGDSACVVDVKGERLS